MTRKPAILTLSELLKLKGKQKKPVIVYFDRKRWANLTRSLKPTDLAPPQNDTLTFTLTTLPGLGGGLVEIRCPEGEPITGAEGELRCGTKPGVEFPDRPDRPDPEFCVKILHRDGRVSCKGECSKNPFTGVRKKCRLGVYTVPTTIPGLRLVVTSCQCS